MERVQRVLFLAVMFLAFSVFVGSYWISKSIERGFTANSDSLFQSSQNISKYVKEVIISQNDILNQAQAANYLQITEDMLLKEINVIPHVRIGGQNRFSKDALSDWVQKTNFISNAN